MLLSNKLYLLTIKIKKNYKLYLLIKKTNKLYFSRSLHHFPCRFFFFFFLKHLQLELTILKTAANYSSLVDKTLYLENVIMGQDFLGQINIILSNKLYFSATILKDKCYHFPYKFLFSLKPLRLELTILKTPIDFLGINCHSILKVKISNYTCL